MNNDIFSGIDTSIGLSDCIPYEDIYKEIEEIEQRICEESGKAVRQAKALLTKSRRKYLKRVLADIGKDCRPACCDTIKLVKEPKGEWQREYGLGSITGYYVDQWSTGDSGDSFAGFITVYIAKDVYLEIPYTC